MWVENTPFTFSFSTGFIWTICFLSHNDWTASNSINDNKKKKDWLQRFEFIMEFLSLSQGENYVLQDIQSFSITHSMCKCSDVSPLLAYETSCRLIPSCFCAVSPSVLQLLLHLVQVVGSSVVDIVTESSSHHCHALQVCVVTLQITCLRAQTTKQSDRNRNAGLKRGQQYKELHMIQSHEQIRVFFTGPDCRNNNDNK